MSLCWHSYQPYQLFINHIIHRPISIHNIMAISILLPLALIIIPTTLALHLLPTHAASPARRSHHLETPSSQRPSSQSVSATEAYSALFNFIQKDDEIEDKALKYRDRSDAEQLRLNQWMVNSPIYSRYLGQQIGKNPGYEWVQSLSDHSLRQFLSIMLLEYRRVDLTDPNVLGQLTQQLQTNPEIEAAMRSEYVIAQPESP